MKTIILTALATTAIVTGAMAQGSLTGFNAVTQYVTTSDGPDPADPGNATTWYTGGLTMEVYFSANATAPDIAAINALNGTDVSGLATALAAEDFFQVGLSGGIGSPVGSVRGSANEGSFAGFPEPIYLSSAFGQNTPGAFVFLFEGTSSSYDGWSGADAIFGNYGSDVNPFNVAPALDNLGDQQNLVLAPIPEPGTIALAALGGASLLLFRRKK